jgi:hypothetical protein
VVLIRPIEAQQGLNVGGVPGTSVDDSIGRGLQSLGASAQELGAHVMRMKAQNENFASEQGLRRFTGDFSLKFANLTANMDPKGMGLAKETVAQFDKDAAAFLKTVPPGLQGKYKELLHTARSGFADKAVATELDQRDKWFATGVQDRTNELGAQVAQDPKTYDAALSDGMRVIDSTGWTEIRKQDEKRKFESTLKLAKAGFYLRTDPDHLLGRDGGDGAGSGNPVEQVVGRIIGAESGGNSNAKNPNSSASGVGQFTNGTWLATIRKHRPDIASGRSDKELLALKGDPKLGREMTTRLTEDNARDLSSAGQPVTPGNLYLAHFAGIGGAKAILRASPDTPVVDILGPEVTKANGFLNGKTAGWLRNWADKKMGEKGGVYLSPETEGLPLNDRLQIYDQAMAASKAKATADQQEANADYKRRTDAISLGIETSQVTSREQILGAGLRDDDTAKLLRRFDERNKQDNQARATLSALASGGDGAKINSFDADQVKEGENAWRYLKQNTDPAKLPEVSAAFVQSSGYIPRDMQADLRRGAASRDVSAFNAAMTQADALQRVAPASFDNFEGGSDVRQKLALYQGYVNDLGMSGEDAARKVLGLDDPEKKTSREVLKPEADKFVKDLKASEITGEFGFWFGHGTGATPGQVNTLTSEYRELARDYYYETGDKTAAKALAKADIKKRWGVSEISGSPQLMRYPPENHYPPIAGGFGYLRDDAMKAAQEFVSENYPGRKVDSVALRPAQDGETREDIAAGRLPRYELVYLYTENGQQLSDTVWSGLWGMDQNSVKALQAKDNAARRDSFMQENELSTQRNDIMRQSDADAERAYNETVGPDWMKANAMMAERERGRIAADSVKAPPAPAETTPAGNIQQQRQQLFDDARYSGVLSSQDALSGNDPVFGAR